MGFGNTMEEVKYIWKVRNTCIKEKQCIKDEPVLGGIDLRNGILISKRSYFWE